MIIELTQIRLIKVCVLAVVGFIIRACSETYYCADCEHYFDIEDLLDSGGGVCPYCASRRIYDLNGLSCAERENLVYGGVEYV